MWIATTRVAATVGVTAKFWYTPPGTTSAFLEATLPTGVHGLARRPSFADYTGAAKSRTYIVGAHTDNLVFTENCQLFRQGIVAPLNPFMAGVGSGIDIGVAAAAAVGVGRTGSCVCYIAWYDRVHDRRSPLSGPSDAVVLAGQGVAWTNLPVAPADGDPSVTDIELWVSMDGLTPRLSVRRDLGVTAVTEETPTLSLGIAQDEEFERFPVGKYNTSWHDRQVVAGDQRFPDRVYFSVLLEYERYGGLYLRTRRGERVTALYVVRDNLFVCTDKTTYIVTGYTEDDIEMQVLEPAIGCINHHGVANAGDFAFVPTQAGLAINTGESLQNVSQGFSTTWTEEYQTYKEYYEDAFAVVDPQDRVYKHCLVGGGYHGVQGLPSRYGTMFSKYWVLDYTRVAGAVDGSFSSPPLMYDVRGRTDTCAAQLAYPDGRRADVFTGSDDGYIRREGIASNGNDDSDDFDKALIIQSKHYFFGDPGATDDEAWAIETLWQYLLSESNQWVLNLFFGDEHASDVAIGGNAPDWTETVAGSTDSPSAGYRYVAQTKHFFTPNRSGAGITFEVIVSQALAGDSVGWPGKGARWVGWGCTRKPGPNWRGAYLVGG